jgi:hypothetical protein
MEQQIKTHERENNQESEQHLYEHRKHFTQKCIETFQILMLGETLDVDRAHNEFKIRSFPARIHDLKQCGVKITDEMIPGTRMKQWRMTQEQIESNKTFIPKTLSK